MKNFGIIALLLVIVITSADAQKKKKNKGPEEKVKKYLVVSLLGSLENRRTLEDEISTELLLKGVPAVSSYTTNLTSGSEISKEMVIKVCENVGADGVIITQVLNRVDSQGYSSRYYKQYGEYYYWGTFAFYYGPGWEIVETSDVTVRTDVFTVPEGKLLFENNYNVTVGSNVEAIIGLYSEKLTKKMQKKQLSDFNEID